ncbi:hypothetical protein TYRP_009383 [Tyrophagus putrescentiae]|nr:hypothetical protein TYRP_009383 [Tyrophagus putrescentiae]
MLGSASSADKKLVTEKGLKGGTVVHFPQWSPLMKAKYAFAFKFSLLRCCYPAIDSSVAAALPLK